MLFRSRIDAVVGQLGAGGREPWESLRETLDGDAWVEMGDVDEVGSGGWHLMHIAEVFRVHAKAVIGDAEVEGWPAIERSVTGAGRMVREDVERFAAWCVEHPDRCGVVKYGGEMSFEEMVGVMLRHIVWHSAAVHYWCLWRGSSS